MQDYLKAKRKKTIAFQSQARTFQNSTLWAYNVTCRSIYFRAFTDSLKKAYVPSLPLGLAL